MPHTVEVGSLHTLRWESLKLIFQPLHKCIFGKSVRTSTLSMISNFSNNCLDRLFHCVTIPVDQKFTYTKLTVPLNFRK
jgi:hypothetical protein